MEEKKRVFRLFLQQASEAFTLAILGLTVTGLLLGDRLPSGAGVFILGREGTAYWVIIQFFAWACVMGALIVILTSDIFFGKIMLLRRCMMLFFLGIAATAAFALVFEWIPLDAWQAWVGFLVFFTATFGISLLISYMRTRLENKRYERLLSDYKAKKEENT